MFPIVLFDSTGLRSRFAGLLQYAYAASWAPKKPLCAPYAFLGDASNATFRRPKELLGMPFGRMPRIGKHRCYGMPCTAETPFHLSDPGVR